MVTDGVVEFEADNLISSVSLDLSFISYTFFASSHTYCEIKLVYAIRYDFIWELEAVVDVFMLW